MILDEEQKARELEQQIVEMQGEDPVPYHHEPANFQGLNYLDERGPLAPQFQASPWPQNIRAGTYLKYNGNADPTQYIMSYQVALATPGGDDATMAKSFIIALEGPALTWYSRLPPLSIDSWKTLSDKFLLNFQGYRLETDIELSLYRQQ
jgi:hypothetical protein